MKTRLLSLRPGALAKSPHLGIIGGDDGPTELFINDTPVSALASKLDKLMQDVDTVQGAADIINGTFLFRIDLRFTAPSH